MPSIATRIAPQSLRASAQAGVEWVHVLTPGDHYSPNTGSAVISVVHAMNRWHLAAGGRARVLVERGTWSGFDDGARQEIHFRRQGTPSPAEKLIDRTLGGIAGRRILSGRSYLDAADALGRDFDGVVFVHNEPSGIERVARRCPRAKVVLWAENELFRTYTRRQARRVLRFAHRFICCSDFVARGIRALVGEDARIAVVLNGVDTEMFRPPDPRPVNNVPVILYVGRVVPEKGIHVLVRAAQRLYAEGISFRLRIVGSGGFNATDHLARYEKTLRNMAGDIGDAVEFLPFQPRTKIVALYQSADVFCVPSIWNDPCPLTAIEALACGLPTVASRRGGIPEICLNNVLMFEPNDRKSLPKQLRELLANRSLRTDLSVRARQRALELSWERQYTLISRLISEG